MSLKEKLFADLKTAMKEKSIKIYDIVLIISLIYYFLEVFVLHWYISSDSIKYVSIDLYVMCLVGVELWKLMVLIQ